MGKELRLQQQYFFVACSIHDIVQRHLKTHEDFADFPDKVAIQLNDTHPAMAVAELMRVLVDEHELEWDAGLGASAGATFGYTNHTLMPEALERWSVDLFGRVLPRHLEIVYEVNRRFLDEVRRVRRGRRGGPRAHEPDRGGAGQAGPDGQPRGGRLALGQRRGRAPHRAAEARAVPRTSTRSGRSGSTTRPTASRRAAGCCSRNPALAALDHRRDRRRAGSPTLERCSSSSRSPTTPAFRRLFRDGQAGEQGAAGRDRPGARTASRSTSTRSSTCR